MRDYKIDRGVENHVATSYINAVMVDKVIHGYLKFTTSLSSKQIRQLPSKRSRKLIKLFRNDVEPVLELFIILPIALELDKLIITFELQLKNTRQR